MLIGISFLNATDGTQLLITVLVAQLPGLHTLQLMDECSTSLQFSQNAKYDVYCMYVYMSFGWPVPQGSMMDSPGTGLFNSPGLRYRYRGA